MSSLPLSHWMILHGGGIAHPIGGAIPPPRAVARADPLPGCGLDSVPRYGRYRSRVSGMTIGKLAAAEGVSVETVRFYQRRGLLAEPPRQSAGYREYSDADRARLVFIR